MKKIVHVITNLKDGGAEAVLYRLCQSTHLKLEVTVISLRNEAKYGPLLQKEGIPVYCLHMNNFVGCIKGLYTLYKLLRQIAPDVVQTWLYHADLFGGLVARIVGVKKIYWSTHNMVLTSNSGKLLTYLISKLLSFLSYIVPTKIVCCAKSVQIDHEGIGYERDKIQVIYNGCDTAVFKPSKRKAEEMRRLYEISDETFCIGMVARYSPVKDHLNLLYALKKILSINVRCVLVGEGVEKLEPIIKRLGLEQKVKVIGQQSDISTLMNLFSILVLPSKSEACPNVVIEAMATGVPCVVTDVGDCKFLVGETGWVVPPSDAKLLSNALLSSYKAWLDPFGWANLRSSARTRAVDFFDINKMVHDYLILWNAE